MKNMVITQSLEKNRVEKYIQVPKIKEICPKEKLSFSDNTVFMIYKDDDLTYPNVGEIDRELSSIYHKPMIKCYIAKRDTADILENILFPNIKERENLAVFIEELSKLNIVDRSKINKIDDINIEHDKIYEIYERYKDILAPACNIYRFCYYWVPLCISLDVRVFKGKPTVIHRSLIVRDAAAFIRGQIEKEEYGTSWEDVKNSVDPAEMITDVKYVTVREHERELKSDRFTHKKGEKVPVKRHGKIRVTTE